jgi:AcrR family transcriptional regulator
VSTQRRDKTATRQLLLDAGFEMMLERGLDVGWGVRVADVTERVGLTTGAAYQIWSGSRTRDGRGGQDKFHRDLALHAIERLIAERAAAHTTNIETKRSDGRALEAIVQQVASDDLRPENLGRFALYVGLCAAATSVPEITEVGRRNYRQVTDTYVSLLEKTHEHFELEMVPPHTLEDLAVATLALVEGLCLRAIVDPDSVVGDREPPPGVPSETQGPWHLASVGVLTLIRGMTRPKSA